MNLILFIIRLFISLISIIKINLLIFFLSFLRPKKKFILFYYPEKKLTYKDIDYIEDLFKDIGEKYYILYGHRLNNFHRKNYFFISQKFLNFIFGINLFVSTYISDNFPSKSIKIFIYHCIYDTPLAEKKKEFEITLRISNYNYKLVDIGLNKIKKIITYTFKSNFPLLGKYIETQIYNKTKKKSKERYKYCSEYINNIMG